MIGRKKEVEELTERYNSPRAELVSVYGRRRVGKTYLIDEAFKGKITFRHAGVSPVEPNAFDGMRPLKIQLQAFYYSLLTQGMKKSHTPKDWLEAFFMLEMFLQKIDDGSRQLVFLDEMPWMDTPKSGFITAFESFWNGWGCHRSNLMVVVCGSANSWIMDKLINNHGGLYNRVTCEIKVSPFTLKESEECFESLGVHFSRYDITQSMMIVGGIPYYLNLFQRGKSLAQNIDRLFFAENAKLSDEYDRLFASVFSNPDMIKKIIETLNQRSSGLTRKEIAERSGFANNGMLSDALKALTVSNFVESYIPFGKSKIQYFKLTDPFCIFYLKFVKDKEKLSDSFWQMNTSSQMISSWRGFAFEQICFRHIEEIRRALGIQGVYSEQSAWSKTDPDNAGTQIDLLIIRKDNVVDMCEIKFYGEEFSVDKSYDLLLHSRQLLLSKELPKRFVIHNVLITTYGLKQNSYSSVFEHVLTLDHLFT